VSKGPFYRESLKRPRGRRRKKRFGGRSPRPNRILPKFLTRSLRHDYGVTGLGIALRATVAAGVLLVLLSVVVAGGAAASAVYGWTQMTSDLPDYEDVEALQFETTKIYDRNNRLLHEVSDPLTGWRTAISYDELVKNVERYKDRPDSPEQPWIFDAMIAAEDSTFWSNPGVDLMAITRSLITNLSGQPTSGASTISQQLVRTLFPESIGYEHSYTRKLREAVMAWHFNREFEKEEILEMYLNNVYFGNRAYGIDAAAQAYFNKFAWNLSLAEAAMLAGLPQAPSLYDPNVNYELAKSRQRYVLDRMVEQGMITQLEADLAYEEPITPKRREGRHDLAPHFVNYVRYVIEQEYGAEKLFRGGLTIRTTLDYELQLEAERIVREGVAELEPWEVENGALISMLPWSGEILTMVGSVDFYNDSISGQVNVTTQERQPGSSIKPINYLAALEAGMHPGTMIFDYAKEWETPLADEGVYAPHNATGQFYGAVSMREALGNSLNVPAVQTLDHVGVEQMINLAHRMGIRHGLWRGMDHYGLAITLGGGEVSLLELTNVFATLANNGAYVPYSPFLEIIDGNGETIFELDRETALEQAEQVVRAEYSYQMTDMLADNDARTMVFGADSPLVIPELGDRKIAVKTGTTDDARDGWSMGYSTEIVTGVWTGNTDNRPTRSLDGVASAAPIWNEFMRMIHTSAEFRDLLLGPDGAPLAEEFERPDGIIQGEICATTGKRPVDGAETVEELLVDGGAPRIRCDQMNEYEEEELEAALEDAQSNDDFTARGIESLREYALMVGVRTQLIEEEEPEDQDEPEISDEVPEVTDDPVDDPPAENGGEEPDEQNGGEEPPLEDDGTDGEEGDPPPES
jgi:penicillin-binding protein 1C